MLLSQSLFIDSEYKADCENKINYINLLEKKADAILIDKNYTIIDNEIVKVKKISGNTYKIIEDTTKNK